MEFGSQAFADHVIGLKDEFEKKEALTLVTAQFLSYHDFASKMNDLNSQINKILPFNKIEDVMMLISKSMSSVFSAEKVHLWLTDVNTGVFYTLEPKGQVLRCYSNEGIISMVINKGTFIHRKSLIHGFCVTHDSRA